MENLVLTTEEQLRLLFRQELKSFAYDLQPTNHHSEDRWYDIDELIDYLPGNPAKATIYGYVSRTEIPYHKTGKRLSFLKSEIDNWLKSKRRKTSAEIAEEALQYTRKKVIGGVR
jgi:predicted DNA-binding transcriptional regulator AlpA